MAEYKVSINATPSKVVKVDVTPRVVQNDIVATPDSSLYYSNLSKQWAIGDGLVQSADYSSKHYANVSAENAQIAEAQANLCTAKTEELTSNFESYNNDLLVITNSSKEEINSSAESAKQEINTVATSAKQEITTTKNTALTQINQQAQIQINNIESTGFYMRDDKLYFINSEGEEEEFKSGGGGTLQMFDTVLKDHILTFEESQGLALQGTYVYKEAIAGERYGYPDFYAKCLEEYNQATDTETVNGKTVKVHSNGHKFYDIADKTGIDDFFNTMGSAWFYGIDTENERIFLPRNNYFEQPTGDVNEVGLSVEAGLPNITGSFNPVGSNGDTVLWHNNSTTNGAFTKINSGTKILANAMMATTANSQSLGFDASKSNPIYGNSDTVQPDAVKKLLYICVGNTTSSTSWVNVVEQVEEGVKDIEEAKDYAVDQIRTMAGGGRVEIGDIGITGLGIDETKGLRRYLNGQIVIQEQYIQFTNKLKAAINLYPTLSCSEDEWQTTATMTVGGQVGKFVVDDDAGTIRLPKIIMPIQGLTDLSKLAEIVEAGLPNFKGTFNTDYARTTGNLTGESVSVSGGLSGSSSTNTDEKVTIDLSNASKVYRDDINTVQQEQIQYPYFIQVATGAETEDNIINEIELNNPYSFGDSKYSPKPLNNLSWLKSEGQYNYKITHPAYYDWALVNANNGVEGFKFITDEYTDYDVVVNTADETFRLPLLNGGEKLANPNKDTFTNWTVTSSGKEFVIEKNGTLSFQGQSSATNQYVSLQVLNPYRQTIKTTRIVSSTASQYISVETEVERGQIVIVAYTVGTVSFLRFTPSVGNGSLYYYVGETVQNAHLINAGRIEEKLSSCLSRSNKEEIVSWGMPDYENGITITASAFNSTINWVLMPCSALVCVDDTVNQDYYIYISKDKTTILAKNYHSDGFNGTGSGGTCMYVPKGYYVACIGFTSATTAKYFPLKGVKS